MADMDTVTIDGYQRDVKTLAAQIGDLRIEVEKVTLPVNYGGMSVSVAYKSLDAARKALWKASQELEAARTLFSDEQIEGQTQVEDAE